MSEHPENAPSRQQLLPAASDDEVSTAQITALVGSFMEGLKPLTEQQARVQMAQIEAGNEREERATRFARTTLFTSATVLLVILGLLAAATTFLLRTGNHDAAMQVIWFALGTVGGFGFGRAGRPRQ